MSKKLDLENVRIYSNTKDDVVDAINLIGEKVYFSDDVDFESFEEGDLVEVCYANNISYPFIGEYGYGTYKYFILEKDAKFKEEEKEKKYRPYMGLAELPFVIGDIIRYKCKQCCSEYKGIVLEVEYQKNYPYEIDSIIIGGINATPQELFDHYELLDKDCKYVPFGFEE